MSEKVFGLLLLVIATVLPVVVTFIAVKRRLSTGAAFLLLLGLAFVDSFGFWTMESIIANVINGSGGSSAWNGEATLGLYILAAGLFVWCVLWSAVASITLAIVRGRKRVA
ncbi:MAG TPA: hypothetical protein VII75_01255 [Thermoanaerobaculia bacterium]